MKTKSIALKNLLGCALRPASTLLLLCLCAQPSSSQILPPQFTSATVANGKLMLAWSGNSYSYEVQTAATPQATNWTSILATARKTNVLVPLQGNVAFFRVIDPDTNLTRLDITTSNVTTGDFSSLSKIPQTNADLVFSDINNSPSGSAATQILLGDDLQKFDMAFDGAGGFTYVNTNGEPTQFRGQMTSSPTPGTNTITYTGHVTDGTNFLVFTAVAADPVLNVGDAALSAVWCSGAWAAQNLQCQAASGALIFGCVFSGGPVGIIVSRSGVSYNGTNLVGECTSVCQTCCKNKVVNGQCTQ